MSCVQLIVGVISSVILAGIGAVVTAAYLHQNFGQLFSSELSSNEMWKNILINSAVMVANFGVGRIIGVVINKIRRSASAANNSIRMMAGEGASATRLAQTEERSYLASVENKTSAPTSVCFTEGTPVALADHKSIAIDKITLGTMVLTAPQQANKPIDSTLHKDTLYVSYEL